MATPHPLITPIGRMRATFFDSPARIDDVDHVIDVLVRLGLLLRQAPCGSGRGR